MFQWYPGHMARSKRELKDKLKLVDLVLEVVDARIPESSRNPELDELLEEKNRVIILNKVDLASSQLTQDWLNYFKKQEYQSISINALQGKGLNNLKSILNNKMENLKARLAQKDRDFRPLRLLIAGIPNTGKSALINKLAGKSRARTGAKAGITRGKQWVKVADHMQLLDTPGLLWPKIESEERGYKLALTGAVPLEHFDPELVAYKFLKYLLNEGLEQIIENTYGVNTEQYNPYDIFLAIGKSRGCIMSGGKIDKERAGEQIVNDFQSGKLGKHTLEKPPILGDQYESS